MCRPLRTFSNNNLAGLASAINAAGIGVTASVVTNSTTGLSSLELTSNTWAPPAI